MYEHQNSSCLSPALETKIPIAVLSPLLSNQVCRLNQFPKLLSKRLSPAVQTHREGTKNLSENENLARVFLKKFEDIQNSIIPFVYRPIAAHAPLNPPLPTPKNVPAHAKKSPGFLPGTLFGRFPPCPTRFPETK